jgi:CRP-like cAMP-binding protein
MTEIDLKDLKLQILRNLQLFSDLNDEELQELANISVLCTLEKGTIIYRQGNKPEFIYIISEGKIKSFSYSLSGRTLIANVSADLIGLQNIFSGEPLWVSAEAMNHVTALKVSGSDFRSFIAHKPKLLLKILRRAEKTMTCLFNRLNVLADCSADQRVIDILFGLYEKFGLILPFRMAEIAALSGLTRETTIRVTSRLRKQGIIKSIRTAIVITDIDRLRILKQYYPVL